MVMSEATVPVTQRALMQRLNRALRPRDEMVRQARGDRARQDLGDFYVVDAHRNVVVRQGIDLEAFAREMGVLKGYERLVGDDEA